MLNSINIVKDEIQGRYAIATKFVERGEALIIEEAFAFVPTDAYREVACAYCGKLNINGTVMAISPDDTVRYCSEKCIINDYNNHIQSAEALKKLSNLGVVGSGSEPLRLILKIAGMRKIESKDINFSDDIPLLGKANNFASIKCLEAATQYIDSKTVEELKQTSKTISKIANEHKLLLSDKEALHLLYAIQCNAHQILDDKDRAIGLGLFPFTSMLNHSCAPNCAHYFDITANGIPKLIMRATKDILPGSEICYSYVSLYSSAITRRLKLQKAYQFLCNCSRCTDNDNNDDCIDKVSANVTEKVNILSEQVQCYANLLNDDENNGIDLFTLYDSLNALVMDLIPQTNIYHKFVLQSYIIIAKAGYKISMSSGQSLEILKCSFTYALLALGCIYCMTGTRQKETGELELLIAQLLYSISKSGTMHNTTSSDFLAFVLDMIEENGELNLYLQHSDNEVQRIIEYGISYASEEFKRLHNGKNVVKIEDLYIAFATTGLECIRVCRGDEYLLTICRKLPSSIIQCYCCY